LSLTTNVAASVLAGESETVADPVDAQGQLFGSELFDGSGFWGLLVANGARPLLSLIWAMVVGRKDPALIKSRKYAIRSALA